MDQGSAQVVVKLPSIPVVQLSPQPPEQYGSQPNGSRQLQVMSASQAAGSGLQA